MKLLLDENLSRRIVPFLQAAFPSFSRDSDFQDAHWYPVLL